MGRSTVTVERGNGEVVCERCLVAATFWTRLRGLLGRDQLPATEGVLLGRTGSVHTLFMRFPIDVVFLDAENAVVKIVPKLRPWRFALARRAKRTLELAPGACAEAGVVVGERLELGPGQPAETA
jgi:uncharacterized membrane protein (UPF0127 family)